LRRASSFAHSHGAGVACRPHLAHLYAGSGRVIAVLRVTGILGQQLAGNVRALAAVDETLFLTAFCHGAFPVKGMALRFYTAAAVVCILIVTALALQAAA